MRKGILAWSLAFLLAISIIPSAYAAEGNLGTATVNEYYSCTVYGAAADTQLTVEDGSALPPGFALEGNMLFGTPTQAGDYDFTVTDGSNPIHCTLTVVAVADPSQLSSISLNTAPSKLEYALGESLDTTGLLINLHYAGGGTESISSGFGYYPMVLDTVGTVPVEVSYQGFKCYFNVTVTDSASQIGGIGLVSLPAKTEYKPGDEFVPSGIIIRVYRLDKSHYDIDSGYSYSPSVLEKEGEQTITLSYEGKSCNFTVKVARDDVPSALYVGSYPTKTSYLPGESLDTTGLTLKLVMSSGASQSVSSGFTCSPVVLTGTGSQQIKVSYGQLSCVFNVTVTDNTPPVSPSPSPSHSPKASPSASPSVSPLVSASPLPSATPHIIEHESHRLPAGTVLLSVILVVSLLLLIALGGYVYVASHGGMDNVKRELRRFLRRFKRK